MASISGLIAWLRLCPDVVTTAADQQMLELIVQDIIGIPGRKRRTGNNPLWMATWRLSQLGCKHFLVTWLPSWKKTSWIWKCDQRMPYLLIPMFPSCINAKWSSPALLTIISPASNVRVLICASSLSICSITFAFLSIVMMRKSFHSK